MIKLTKEQILMLHPGLIKTTGGSGGIGVDISLAVVYVFSVFVMLFR